MKETTFFIGSLEEGGAERVLANLTNSLVESGKKIGIVLYHDREIFYDLDSRINLHIVTKETRSKNIIKNIWWIRQYFKKYSCLVVSFLTVFNLLAIISLFFTNVPVVVSERSDPHFAPENKFIRWLRDILYYYATEIVVQTGYSKNYFSKILNKKCNVIMNPVNVGKYEKYGLTQKKSKTIVTVGRLMPVKNQKMLIDAFSVLSEEFPEFTLEIYGDGPEMNNLEKHIKTKRLEGKAILKGSSHNIYDVLSTAYLFVLTSNYEGMPNALIEAMCIGTPVISTKVSGAIDLIEDNYNGILIDVGNCRQLEDSMRTLLSRPDTAKQFSKRAVSISDQLSLERIVEQWEDVFGRLASHV